MSPTLLEAVVVVVLIIVAWQLGLALAPIVLSELRALRQSLDDASDRSLADDTDRGKQEEETHGSRH